MATIRSDRGFDKLLELRQVVRDVGSVEAVVRDRAYRHPGRNVRASPLEPWTTSCQLLVTAPMSVQSTSSSCARHQLSASVTPQRQVQTSLDAWADRSEASGCVGQRPASRQNQGENSSIARGPNCGRQLCWQYRERGHCSRGDSCRFLHVDAAPLENVSTTIADSCSSRCGDTKRGPDRPESLLAAPEVFDTDAMTFQTSSVRASAEDNTLRVRNAGDICSMPKDAPCQKLLDGKQAALSHCTSHGLDGGSPISPSLTINTSVGHESACTEPNNQSSLGVSCVLAALAIGPARPRAAANSIAKVRSFAQESPHGLYTIPLAVQAVADEGVVAKVQTYPKDAAGVSEDSRTAKTKHLGNSNIRCAPASVGTPTAWPSHAEKLTSERLHVGGTLPSTSSKSADPHMLDVLARPNREFNRPLPRVPWPLKRQSRSLAVSDQKRIQQRVEAGIAWKELQREQSSRMKASLRHLRDTVNSLRIVFEEDAKNFEEQIQQIETCHHRFCEVSARYTENAKQASAARSAGFKSLGMESVASVRGTWTPSTFAGVSQVPSTTSSCASTPRVSAVDNHGEVGVHHLEVVK